MTYLDVGWTCGGVWHSQKNWSKWVHYWSQTPTLEWLSAQHQSVLVTFLGFRKPLCSCTEGMCHSSTCPGTSLHVTHFTRPSPTLVLQVTNAGVRRPGYKVTYSTYRFSSWSCWAFFTHFSFNSIESTIPRMATDTLLSNKTLCICSCA